MTAAAAPVLRLQGVHTHIGAYHILHGVDLDVPEGEVTVLLGRNPAGQQGPGLEPVMFAGDADYLATLPADGGCSPGQTSVILLPQSPDLVAGTIRELRLTGRGGGCQVDIRQGPDGGTVAIVRG